MNNQPVLTWGLRATNFLVVVSVAALAGCAAHRANPTKPTISVAGPPPTAAASGAQTAPAPRRVIVFVWDGLRPDAIRADLTPVLARLRDQLGVNFSDQHAVYPTFTMMNAAALATGAYPAAHGFYGNSEYQPGPTGQSAGGTELNFAEPIFTEDYATLRALDTFYRNTSGGALLRVQSLFEAAHAAGLRTAAIGKSGPAFMQDYRQDGASGVVLDENVVIPRSFALALHTAGFALPKNSARYAYPDGALILSEDNGNPTAVSEPALVTLADGVTPDPRADGGSPHKARNAYLMQVFTDYVLPELDPALSVIWLRNPDSTQHSYGPGSPNALDALRHQDQLLGQLLAALEDLNRSASTDLLIMSDHGQSSVAGDAELFPLRALSGTPNGEGQVGEIESNGYAVSGEIRSARVLHGAGFAHVYDGVGCVFDPVLAGMSKRAQPIYETQRDLSCATSNGRFQTPSFRVPGGALSDDAIIVAANGGSEYFYVPSHDRKLVQKLVSALQERGQYGALFVRSVYGELPGTLSLARIQMEGEASASPPTPDVVASLSWDDGAISAGGGPSQPGSEYTSALSYRGMHGAFSPRDVHNVLIALGPSFRKGFVDNYPSGNVDVAPTVAHLLGLTLPNAQGRVLTEALEGADANNRVTPFVQEAGLVALRKRCRADDPDCKHPLPGGTYRFSLRGRELWSAAEGRHYTYFDSAKAVRE
jgi:arylsulfatase A-like enzyme